MNGDYQYLGTGIKWPIEITQLGSIAMESDVSLVVQSIIRYLETPIGTEFFNEDIGSRIGQIGYEPNDELLMVLLDMLIAEAVDNETRCEYIETVFTIDPDMPEVMQCTIHVRIRSSNEVTSFIWPYYKEKSQLG
jgi:phage baseplate assembly protein W